MARFAPFFLANALFRICAFALIIVFLDWWSVIPFALLLLLNLVRHCIITTNMESSLSREDFLVSFSYFSTMHPAPDRAASRSSILNVAFFGAMTQLRGTPLTQRRLFWLEEFLFSSIFGCL